LVRSFDVLTALIGLSPNGLGVVGGDYTDLVGLGGCKPECKFDQCIWYRWVIRTELLIHSNLGLLSFPSPLMYH
jgi:hypothetical protein